MSNFFFGVFIGIVVATVGFNGVTSILDRGVDSIKNGAQEYVRS